MILQQPTSGHVPVSRLVPVKAWDQGFNVAVLHIANRLNPRGWGLVSGHTVSTLEKLKQQYTWHGRIVISGQHSDHTIFGDPDVNYAFRAWHDWCNLSGNHEFSVPGEYRVSCMQYDHLRALYGKSQALVWRPLIDAEVNAQARHAAETGQFPTDQMEFDRAYIRDTYPASRYAV